MLSIYGFIIILSLKSIKSVYYRRLRDETDLEALLAFRKAKLSIDYCCFLFLVYHEVDKVKEEEVAVANCEALSLHKK